MESGGERGGEAERRETMTDWHPDIPLEYRNEIATGDARELAKRIPGGCARLAFADPPYWVGFDYGHTTDEQMDYIDPVWLVSEMKRIASIVCITPGIANERDYPKPDWILGWFKFGSTRRSAFGGFNCWEPVLVYGELSRRPWQDAINLPDAQNHSKDTNHKCPKPTALLSWLISELTERNDLVIDPTAGSGTTCKASKQLGRRWIGFEIDPDTAQRARERVARTQPPLFVLPNEQPSLFDAALDPPGP